ncbi:hypothetical protein [Nibricoccus sp. IMCC34717]|uniref:hypothetical protein n=1 Tax=Nibricoccus sp. IMCC34717 TaxID=3034021 RepID=UPI00384EA0E8
MNRWLQPLYLAGSHAAEALLSVGGLAGGCFLNNWLLATNLHPTALDAETIIRITSDIRRAEPSLPVVIRSLTPALHGGLIKELVTSGYLLLPTRQVWIVNDPKSGGWRKRRDSKRDLTLARDSAQHWTWVEVSDFSDADFTSAHSHFQRLYRERYPRHNPDYTEAFIRRGVATGFLDVRGLRPADGGPLAGFVGMIHRESTSCTPLLGYDIDAPIGLGLYRLLMLNAFETCARKGTRFHCSAGAGLFKFNRGAEPSVEFAAVWANHLSLYKRADLKALAAAVNRWVLPYLERHKL